MIIDLLISGFKRLFLNEKDLLQRIHYALKHLS